jgi:Caspase domain
MKAATGRPDYNHTNMRVPWLRSISLWIFGVGLVLAQTEQTERGVKALRVDQTDRVGLEDEVKVAIVVGINSYSQDSDLPGLRFAEADAQAMGDRLAELGYKVTPLLGERARATPVLHAIDEAGKLIGSSQGTLVFYFAGHGLSDQDRKNYLVTFGAGRERMSRDKQN